MMLGWRFLLTALALAAYGSTRPLVPVYRSRPEILLEAVSLLIPPGLLGLSALALAAFAAGTLGEAWLYRRWGSATCRSALAKSLHTSRRLLSLLLFVLLFFPGAPFVPMTVWWLMLDGGSWLLSLAVIATAYSKLGFLLGRVGSWGGRAVARAAFALGLFIALALATPARRFTQPYDERWGTGDEPRYIRIAASLLHDQDADVRNAPGAPPSSGASRSILERRLDLAALRYLDAHSAARGYGSLTRWAGDRSR